MRALKPVLFSIIIILLVIVVVQNLEVFMDKKALQLNLLVWSKETQAIPLSVYFLGFFLLGLLLSYIYGLSERFKARKTIQNHMETIRKSEEEIKALKSLPFAEQEQPSSLEDSESA
jgi:uncharacterized integral membrane protein